MTSDSIFPNRLTVVDALLRPDHHLLTAEDYCYFLGEYTARQGFAFSKTNSLISNLKKSVEVRHKNEWRYKESAIKEAGSALNNALQGITLQGTPILDIGTFVPIPPSKAKNDPLYDDRMTRIIQAIRNNPPVDMRELIVQKVSTEAAHQNNLARRPESIEANYLINPACFHPLPNILIVLDDVLTTGAHFKAAQSILKKNFPSVQVVGLFIARCSRESMDFDAL